MKCNHEHTYKCGTFSLWLFCFFFIFLYTRFLSLFFSSHTHFHFHFIRLTLLLTLHSSRKYYIYLDFSPDFGSIEFLLLYEFKPKSSHTHTLDKAGISVVVLCWTFSEKKVVVKVTLVRSTSYLSCIANLILSQSSSIFRGGYQVLLFIVAVIFLSVFSRFDMLFPQNTHTHTALRKQSRSSSEFVCILKILRKRNTWWMKKNTNTHALTNMMWGDIDAMCVYAFTGKRCNNLICFSFQFVFLFVRSRCFLRFFFWVVIFRFVFFSFLLFYILFLCSVLFFSLWFSLFLIVVGIVLYTEGIFNNNGK